MPTSDRPLLLPAAGWTEPVKPGPGVTVWHAGRPLQGAETWEGHSTPGHYAAVPEGAQAARDKAVNRVRGARQVILMTNGEVLRVLQMMLQADGYALTDYLTALAPEAPERIVQRVAEQYGLPWSAQDSTAAGQLATLVREAGREEPSCNP